MSLRRLALALAFAAGPSLALPAAAASEDTTARTVFQVLLGELALRSGDPQLALDAWRDLALRSRDPQAAARATEIAAGLKRYDLAIELSQLWMEIAPDSIPARQAHAALLAATSQLDDLAPRLEKLLADDPAHLPGNLLQLHRMFAQQRDKAAAQALIDRLTAPYEGLPEAHFARAQAAAGNNDLPQAIAGMTRALERRPDWEAAALARAQLQAKASPADAVAGLASFVKRHPQAADARLLLARLLIAERRYDDARRQFTQLMDIAPDNPDLLYPAAMLAVQASDLDTARHLFEHLLDLGHPERATILLFLGQIAQDRQQPAAALDYYQQIRQGEQFIPARGRIAQILVQQGRTDDALRVLRETTARTPGERSRLAIAEGQLLREAQRDDEAFRVLDAALTKDADNPDLLYDSALIAERLGKMEVLETRLRKLIAQKPDHAHALNALGYSFADRNLRLDEARQLIARALLLAPDDPFIMDSMGWVLFRQGEYDDALKTLQAAYHLRPDPEIAAHLSEVLAARGRPEEARQLLRDALREHPDSDLLRRAAERLAP